jgi:hypothetical protein
MNHRCTTLERDLRRDAAAGRVVAPPRLRRRIVGALRENQAGQPDSRLAYSLPAALGLCFTMIIVSIIAFVITRPDRDKAHMEHAADRTTEIKSLNMFARGRTTPSHLALSRPLLDEAQHIAADARHTVQAVRRNLPLPAFRDQAHDGRSLDGTRTN